MRWFNTWVGGLAGYKPARVKENVILARKNGESVFLRDKVVQARPSADGASASIIVGGDKFTVSANLIEIL